MKKKDKKKKINFIKKNSIIIILIPLLILSLIINIFLFNKPTKKEETFFVDENIVFFGDSITKKYNVEEFFQDKFVINSGISGDKTEDLINRIENDVYKYNPSKVFILIGINDLNHDVDEEKIINNIQKIVNGIKLKRKYAKIYIESIYPINRNTLNEKEYEFNENITNDKIKEINKKIENLCKENNIEYIDIFSELVDNDDNLKDIYTIEGLHLNDLGYFKVTSELEKYVYDEKK